MGSPWDGLADDPVVIVWRADLPAGVDGASQLGDPPVIALARNLRSVGRRCTLAHERAHLQRGGPSEHPDPVVRRREEHRVDVVAAGLLVGATEFDAWLAGLEEDEPVDAPLVAERWRVTLRFARLLLEAAAARRNHPARTKGPFGP